MTVNNELENMWKVMTVAKFKALPRNLPGGNEENCERIQSG
jgi:hypothetical protein